MPAESLGLLKLSLTGNEPHCESSLLLVWVVHHPAPQRGTLVVKTTLQSPDAPPSPQPVLSTCVSGCLSAGLTSPPAAAAAAFRSLCSELCAYDALPPGLVQGGHASLTQAQLRERTGSLEGDGMGRNQVSSIPLTGNTEERWST